MDNILKFKRRDAREAAERAKAAPGRRNFVDAVEYETRRAMVRITISELCDMVGPQLTRAVVQEELDLRTLPAGETKTRDVLKLDEEE